MTFRLHIQAVYQAIYRFIFGWEFPVILIGVDCPTCGEISLARFRGKNDLALCNECWSWVSRR